MAKILKSIHPDDDYHYQKMGLTKDLVQIWEDGARVDGKKATTSGGITIVISIKQIFNLKKSTF